MGKVNGVENAQRRPAVLYDLSCRQIKDKWYGRALNTLTEAEDFYLYQQLDSKSLSDLDLIQKIHSKKNELLLGLITESFDLGWRAYHDDNIDKAANEIDSIANYIQQLPKDCPLIEQFLDQLCELNDALAITIVKAKELEERASAEMKALDLILDQSIDHAIDVYRSHLKTGERDEIKQILFPVLIPYCCDVGDMNKPEVKNTLSAIIANNLKSTKKMYFINHGYVLRNNNSIASEVSAYFSILNSHQDCELVSCL